MSLPDDVLLDLAAARQARDRATEEVDRLRGLWPRAELQRLQLELAARTAELAALRREHDALAAASAVRLPAPAIAVLRRARRLVRAGRVVARLVRSLPGRAAVRRQRRADLAALAGSGLFDRGFYASVAGEQADPVAHYMWIGCAAGLDPHPLFDSAWYAAQHPDVGLANPFADYLRRGMAAGADPHPLFDTVYYVSQAPAAAGRALAHYDALPPGDTRSASPLFDPVAYAADNPGAAGDPLGHYARVGAARGRDPHPLFDAAWYGGPDPLARWMRDGSGRATNPWGLRPGRRDSPAAPEVSVLVLPSAGAMATARTVLSAGAGCEAILAAGDGPAFANAAARRARAPLLAFLGADMVAHDGWLAPLLGLVRADPRVGIVAPTGMEGGGHARRAGELDGCALLVRAEAFLAAGGFDEGYRTWRFAASALAQAVQRQGLEVWVQPASRVSRRAAAPDPDMADEERFSGQWAAALSAGPRPRRTVLVLSPGLPEPGGRAQAALDALLAEGAVVVLAAGQAWGAWEARGVCVVQDEELEEWLQVNGGGLDEVWSFRPAGEVPVAVLLCTTGAALRHGGPDAAPAWSDGPVGGLPAPAPVLLPA